MAVYVDDAAIPYHGKLFYHLIGDTEAEIHAFAERIGVKRCWWESPRRRNSKRLRFPHYDINQDQRQRAVQAGAIEADRQGILDAARRALDEWRSRNEPNHKPQLPLSR